jgi:hypothetical protein
LIDVAKILRRFPLAPETRAVLTEWFRLVTTHRVIGKQAHDARLAALCNVENIGCLTFNAGDFKRYGTRTVVPSDEANPV